MNLLDIKNKKKRVYKLSRKKLSKKGGKKTKKHKKKKLRKRTKKKQYKKQKGGTLLPIDKQNEIIILYDLYKIILSIINKYVMEMATNISLFDFIVGYENGKYIKMFQSKGFTFEDCTIIGTEDIGYMIDYDPTLFS